MAQIPCVRKMAIETGKQGLYRTGPHKLFPEQPDRPCIRHPVTGIHKTKEPAKGATIHDLELSLLVGKAIECLQHQDLEHHHRS